MTTTGYQGIALAAMLVCLPLLSWGTTSELTALTIAAAALLVAAAASLTVLRFIHPDEKE